jgi:spore coat protein JB
MTPNLLGGTLLENIKTESNSDDECSYKSGELPMCAPLATSWVPMQQDDPPVYDSSKALTRGTLFPGLDLPFMNMVNQTNPYAGTPLGELMALQFVVRELHIYLDTHKNDKDAFKALKDTIALEQEGRRRYTKMYGPLTISDLVYSDTYNWIDDPWPWEYTEKTGGN